MTRITLTMQFQNGIEHPGVFWDLQTDDSQVIHQFPVMSRTGGRVCCQYQITENFNWLRSQFDRVRDSYAAWRRDNSAAVQQGHAAYADFNPVEAKNLFNDLFSKNCRSGEIGRGIRSSDLSTLSKHIRRLLQSEGTEFRVCITLNHDPVYFPWDSVPVEDPATRKQFLLGRYSRVSQALRVDMSPELLEYPVIQQPGSLKVLNEYFGDRSANDAVRDLLRNQGVHRLQSVHHEAERDLLVIQTPPDVVYFLGDFINEGTDQFMYPLPKHIHPGINWGIPVGPLLNSMAPPAGSQAATARLLCLNGCASVGNSYVGGPGVFYSRSFRSEDEVDLVVTHQLVSQNFAALFGEKLFKFLAEGHNVSESVRRARSHFETTKQWFEGYTYSVVGNGKSKFQF